jgi:anti-anti-sigma regulatory factor
MHIHERTVGDVTILDLHGQELIGCREDLYDKVAGFIRCGRRKVLLNVAGVTRWSGEIVGVIVRSYVILSRVGGSLRILGPQAQTEFRSLMADTTLDQVFRIFDNEEAALQSFQEPEPG